ncbi:uncharacterized protein DUF4491 [Mobilisporobacter senegalensis]|uniref:Uncharacterized protein DUF4491 n=1 Tax=Mobilisporobacter senegalensis TaxID=1329262 RepID=A0A3N1XFV6_9FIRM|nr:DUF4491 family protein [Mobilisporobacter senegalensis]ROR23892.1 uncharacterized protein DUF4491 [Mobilisporobacter senegalensis]
MNYDGIIIGILTFVIIGLLHPVVIKAEYYVGTKVWPFFLISGLLCISGSFFINSVVIASVFSILGFSLLWSIRELFEQKNRVARGWFPKNPKKDDLF